MEEFTWSEKISLTKQKVRTKGANIGEECRTMSAAGSYTATPNAVPIHKAEAAAEAAAVGCPVPHYFAAILSGLTTFQIFYAICMQKHRIIKKVWTDPRRWWWR